MFQVFVAATKSFDGCGGKDSLKERCDVEGAKRVGCVTVRIILGRGGREMEEMRKNVNADGRSLVSRLIGQLISGYFPLIV
jgi:hypothetical protein